MTTQPSAESFLNLIHRSRRGKLKVYLGYGPGVGKTYQMLLEGHRLKAQGVDVTVGIVETHGRADTESLCLGLPEVPTRQINYRGVVLRELDLAAVLQRKPEVALIDELAHTNVPGSANTKRYQDVLEILAAGIHVVTTLNVQHLESLYDTVERLIGVRVKERLPDWVLADADQIVNVDLAPEDLRLRLEEGRVYAADRVPAALDNFFRPSNLEQLRELTLREIASIIERRARRTPGEEGLQAPDQIVVCLSSRSPDASALLRFASRLAGKLNRNWYALYVQTSSEDPARLDADTRKRLSDTLALAHQLGAVVFTFKGEDVADTILRFAREYRVGHVVVGRPGELPRWQRLLGRRTPVERLIAGGDHLAIVVVDEVGVREPETAASSAAPAARPAGGPAARPALVKAASSSPSAPPSPSATPAPPATEIGPAAVGVGVGGAGGGTAMGPGGGRRPAGAGLAVVGGRLRISELLAPGAVAFFDQPLSKRELLRLLVDLLGGGQQRLSSDDIRRLLERREQEASTFLSEGIALPHVRIPELPAPRVALGLLRSGLADAGSGNLEQVYLFLCPDRRPEGCLQLLAAAARMYRQPELRAELRRATTAPQAIAAIRGWEEAQDTRMA
ncbi:MAG TPA: PTS sugar transporter subunit IIA [Thermoanaerobaculia bacterium]|nr:PTS sugar transporter subunit IIA [Thermoanaerobaculia bacterium]